MNTTNNRLVFGSDEANDLLKQSKANEKYREINSELESLIDGVGKIGELILGVRDIEKQRKFQPKIEELLRELNWLMVDAGCTWNISNELTETNDMLENAAYAMKQAAECLDNNDVEQAKLYLSEFLAQEPNKRANATETVIGLFES